MGWEVAKLSDFSVGCRWYVTNCSICHKGLDMGNTDIRRDTDCRTWDVKTSMRCNLVCWAQNSPSPTLSQYGWLQCTPCKWRTLHWATSHPTKMASLGYQTTKNIAGGDNPQLVLSQALSPSHNNVPDALVRGKQLLRLSVCYSQQNPVERNQLTVLRMRE